MQPQAVTDSLIVGDFSSLLALPELQQADYVGILASIWQNTSFGEYLESSSPPGRVSALFAGGSYEKVVQVSPLLCEASTTYLDFFASTSDTKGLGCIVWGPTNHGISLQHWRSLLDVHYVDGTSTHMRFYSPDVLALLWAGSTIKERKALMGAYSGLALPRPQGEWLVLCNPATLFPSFKELAADYIPPAAPWFAITENHLLSLAKHSFANDLDASIQHFCAERPEAIAHLITPQETEEAFTFALQQALEWKMTDPFLLDFLEFAITHPQFMLSEKIMQNHPFLLQEPQLERLALLHQLLETENA